MHTRLRLTGAAFSKCFLQLNTMLMALSLNRIQDDVGLIFDAMRVEFYPDLPGDDMQGVADSHMKRLAEYEQEVLQAAAVAR
jgi:hypothetical protein